MKLTINNVPEGCKVEVLRMAAVAVDRYYQRQNETISKKTILTSNAAKNAFRLANGLPKKYDLEDELVPE